MNSPNSSIALSARVRDAVGYYATKAADENVSSRVGRPAESLQKEPSIWADIQSKLRLEPGLRILDVGCGCGFVAARWAEAVRAQGLQAVLVDIPEVITRCREDLDLEGLPAGALSLRPGLFPLALAEDPAESQFDRILCYSLLHYVDDPAEFIRQAHRHLAPGGRLLVGDIPNLNRKGRFLATERGHAFDARYKGVDPASLPKYSDHSNFRDRLATPTGPNLDDAFLLERLAEYRQAGADAFILEQPLDLPFSLTREDLLIVKPHV